jgi:hypothetical protein
MPPPRLGMRPPTGGAQRALSPACETGFGGARVEDKAISSIVVITIIIVVAAAAVMSSYVLLTRRGIEFKTFTNEHYSFKFDYPVGWHFNEWVIPVDAQFAATENAMENTYPYHIDWKKGVIELTVFDKNIYENYFGIPLDNLSSYLSILENHYANENIVLISGPTEISVGKHAGFRLSAGSTIDNIATRAQVEVVVKDNNFYTLLVGSSEENYSNYKSVFEHVVNSFSLLN